VRLACEPSLHLTSYGFSRELGSGLLAAYRIHRGSVPCTIASKLCSIASSGPHDQPKVRYWGSKILACSELSRGNGKKQLFVMAITASGGGRS
jgi:hypothetical protein